MIFSSLDFFIFLIVVLLLVAIAGNNWLKKLILLLASYFFYGYWDVRFLLLIFTSTAVDFLVGQKLFQTEEPGRRKLLLATSIVTNLGILGFFKYYNFFIDSASIVLSSFGLVASNLDIILPVGISFYTFQTMSYTIDIYRKELKPTQSFLNFSLFVAFFPQLVAGPIVRARDFLPQLDQNIKVRGLNLWYGLQIFLIGLIKKLLIADTVASYVDNVFLNPDIFSSATIWLAVVAYAVQIYCDFSGYSDMAIGCARMLGFRLNQNFNMPYLSQNVSEFWRRWHISLSTWLRDYLYISLGGNRKGEFRIYTNLMITMLLGGLWHGASWNFVVWGGLHGVALIVHRLWQKYGQQKIAFPVFVHVSLTFIFVCFCWVVFRVQDAHLVSIIYSKMVLLTSAGSTWIYTPTIIAVSLVILGHIIGYNRDKPDLIFYPSPYSFRAVFTVTMVIFIIYLFSPSDIEPFIYFQF